MKKLILVIATAFAFSTVIFGQERQKMSAEEMAKKQTERMEQKLSLTSEQKAKVEAINLKYAKQQQAEFQKKEAERKAKIAEMEKIRNEKNTELKAVLTADQYNKYQEQRKEKGKRGDFKNKKKRPRNNN